MRRYWCWTFGAACLLCIGVALVVRIFLIANASSYLRSAIRDYGRGNYESALTAANAALLQSPRLPQASLIAGQAAAKMERVDEALHYLRQIEFDGSATAIQGCLLAGRLSFDQGRAAEAERWYRAVVDQDFYQQEAHTQLAYLLGVEGRCFEAAPHLLAGIVSGDYTLHHLILLASSDGVIHDEAFVDRCLREVPDDESVRLGTARTAMKDGRLREALPILRAIVRHSPQLLEAQARLGEVLLESDSDLVSTWQGALPTETADHPEIWAVKGLFCEKRGQFPESARCYWEVVKRDPNHRRANYRLGQVLIRLQRSSEAQSFLQRAELLKELHLAADQAFRHPESRSWKLKVATLCESLGRPWESWAWTNTALAPDSPESDRSLLQTRRKLVLPETPQTLVDQNPASHIDLSDLPLPAVIAASRQAVAKLKSSGSSVH
ncbi:MAG: UnbV, partial [Planctomycetaceae bacterium]|nr:UnbV [Planctomycetaceae bacterium]